MRLSIIALLLASSACAQSTAGLNIPARQTFLLGEYADYAYRAKLDNRGERDVTVRLRDKTSKTVAEEALLPAGEKATFAVAADQEVAIENDNGGRAQLFVRMSRGVTGMRYVNVDGSELDEATSGPDAGTVRSAADAASAATEAPARERVTVKLLPGQRLILGEGSEGGYAARLRTHGNDIDVSARDRNTLRQTQGFGLSGRETVHVRPGEVLYLDNAEYGPSKVTVSFSEPVAGERVVDIE